MERAITKKRRAKSHPFHGYLIVHDLAACSTSPTPEQWDAILRDGFLRDLPRSEAKLINNPDPKLANAYPALVEKFDAWLLFQLGVVGILMESSPLYQRRKEAWHRSDPEKLRQAGAAIARAAKIWQGRARLPLSDPRIYETRKILIPELKLLFSRFQNRIQGRTEKLPVAAELVMELLTADISENSKFFPAIASDHLEALLMFLWKDGTGKRHLARLCCGRKVLAPGFFHDWFGWRFHHDSKGLANIIAKLGSAPH